MGDYAASEVAFTKLTLIDTLEVMHSEASLLLDFKSRRLKLALASLTTGTFFAAFDWIGQTI